MRHPSQTRSIGDTAREHLPEWARNHYGPPTRKKTVHEYFLWSDRKTHRPHHCTKLYSNPKALRNLRTWIKLTKICRFSDRKIQVAVSQNPFIKVHTVHIVPLYVWIEFEYVFEYDVCVQ